MKQKARYPLWLKALWALCGILSIFGSIVLWGPIEFDPRIVLAVREIIVPVGAMLAGFTAGIGLLWIAMLMRGDSP